MPDEAKTNDVARRRTGEGHLFLNRAKLAAQKIVTDAQSDKTAKIAKAHTDAQTTLTAAHRRAAGWNLQKIYVVDDLLTFREFSADGSVRQSRTLAGSFPGELIIDSGAQRLYHVGSAVIGQAGVEYSHEIKYWSMTDGSAGTLMRFDEALSGRLAFDAENRKIYAPTATGGIYCLKLVDNSVFHFVPVPNTVLGAIVVDSTRNLLHCVSKPAGGTDYSLQIMSSDKATLKGNLSDRGSFVYATVPLSQEQGPKGLAVDAQTGYLYGCTWWTLWRAPYDLLSSSDITNFASLERFNFEHSFEAIALDSVSGLIYWSQRSGGDSILTCARTGSISRTRLTQPPEEVFRIANEGRPISHISLVTLSQEVADITQKAKADLAQAPVIAAGKVADAHRTADDKRKAAHGTLEDAHKAAEEKINKRKSEAAEQRLKAQADARDKGQQATDLKEKAKADAEAAKQKAKDDAETRKSKSKEKADDIKRRGQTYLDNKRQQLQNT